MSFANKTGYLPYNVGAAIGVPKVPRTLQERILSRAEVQRLLALESDLRNHALLRLLYVSGSRASEMCALCWRDLEIPDQGRGQVSVLGKGNEVRSILLSADTLAVLLHLRKEAGGGAEPARDAPVFPSSKKGGHLTPQHVGAIVRRAAKRSGIERPVSTHCLRHSHASHALERGARIHLVQTALGHASIATTGIYLHARPDDSSALYLEV